MLFFSLIRSEGKLQNTFVFIKRHVCVFIWTNLKRKRSTTIVQRHLDFLDILLLAKDENGNGLTDLEIRQEVDTFLFEGIKFHKLMCISEKDVTWAEEGLHDFSMVSGHDTTASAISWILYALAGHNECQNKARVEIETALENRNKNYLEWFVLWKVFCLVNMLKFTSYMNGFYLKQGRHNRSSIPNPVYQRINATCAPSTCHKQKDNKASYHWWR